MKIPDLSHQQLSQEAFQAWWATLDEVDRQEFQFLYGGDDYLARFVCAMELLTIQKVMFSAPEDMFVKAYWLAAVYFEPELSLNSPGIRNRAARAWRSDAVQTLYDRVRYRSVRQGSIRIQNKLFQLGEAMLDDALSPEASIEAKKQAAAAALGIVRLADVQEQAVRAERTKRGLQRAREALAGVNENLSERDLTVILKAAKSQLGSEKVLALMAGKDSDG